MNNTKNFFAGLAMMLLLASCDGNDEAITPRDFSEGFEDDISLILGSYSLVHQANWNIHEHLDNLIIGSGEDDVQGRMEFCGSFDFNASDRSFVLDFGESCEQDGVLYSGKVGYRFEGSLLANDGIFTIFFENFGYDDYEINGTLTSTLLGQDNIGRPIFKYDLGGGEISHAGGRSIKLEISQEIVQTAGSGNLQASDNEYEVSGTSSGKVDEKTFHMSTLEPLLIMYKCYDEDMPYPTKGIIDVDMADEPNFTMDFGVGLCDSFATITSEEGEIEIDLGL